MPRYFFFFFFQGTLWKERKKQNLIAPWSKIKHFSLGTRKRRQGHAAVLCCSESWSISNVFSVTPQQHNSEMFTFPQIFLGKHYSPDCFRDSIFERLALTEMDNITLKFNSKNTGGAHQRSYCNKILQVFSLCFFFHQPIVQLTTLQILSELINSLKYVPNSKLALFINIKRLWIRPYWKKKKALYEPIVHLLLGIQ